MDKFITIEVYHLTNTKRKIKVGYLCAEGVPDAYEQMEVDHPKEHDETLVIKAHEVNQLIIDLSKVSRKI